MTFDAIDAWWWPYAFILVAGWFATNFWRLLGVAIGGRMREDSEALVLVAYGNDAGKRAAVALPGQGVQAGGKPALKAPLQPGQAGAPAFDRQGRLVGIVTDNPSDKILIAGVAPQRSYGFADAAAIQAVLGKAGVVLPPAAAGAELSTGAVVERVSSAVQPIICGL